MKQTNNPIPLTEVPDILAQHFGADRSLMTVYYWAREGIGGKKLKTTRKITRLYTTMQDLSEFVGGM